MTTAAAPIYQLPMPGGPLQDTTSLGLYGALVVLPQGATGHDMQTGQNLLNAANQGIGAPVQADVHVPGPANDSRDYVAVFMDEPEDVLDRDGREPTFPTTGLPDSTLASITARSLCATGCERRWSIAAKSSTRPPSTSYPRRRKRSSCPTGPWSSRAIISATAMCRSLAAWSTTRAPGVSAKSRI
jgi:hypothetical protein